MTMKDDIKARLIASMKKELDPYMIEQGFTRGKASLVYKRHYQGSTQKIDVEFYVHPKDNSNASAVVYPRMEVLVPAVDRILDDIVGDDLGLLAGFTKGTSKQPIGFTSEKADPGRWFVYQPDSIPPLVKDMKAFIERWTMPLLDVYATPEDIVAGEERNDGRLPPDRAQTIRVVAAALVCNRKDYAQALMEKWLGSFGARRHYQQVYDYIQRAP